ncbi:MAG: hypothetical protein EP344_00585 [Bacteroidetes bacterium]|nr:MAG: hypothetical protein EP344_00585 [Bacteroidota bacterium]
MEKYEQQRFLRFWEPRRQSGCLRYLGRQAVYHSILLFFVIVVVDWVDYTSLEEALNRRVEKWQTLLFLPLIGLLIGWFTWRTNERLYRKYTSKS